MTLPDQFKKENAENIFIYHYIEEMIFNYRKYLDKKFDDETISKTEFPFLVRIRFNDKPTQKDLVELFKVSEGYTAKLLRKFEDNEYITRQENPKNRREKIVKITQKGIEKTDKLIRMINNWEIKVTNNLTEEEVKTLKKLLFKIIEE